jgi:phosphate:Na+ symporter
MTNFWQFLAGVSAFLFGMSFLENSLHLLAGRTFKLFLKKHTSNKLSAVTSGTLVTAVLQSSSVVTLMILAFVGAGVMSMNNALAVVLGANLGTTLSSWVVALLGFEFSIESFAFPVIAVAGAGLIFFRQHKKFKNIALFVFGFGLLFLGIFYMKTSIQELLKSFDLSWFSNANRVTFVLIGFIITALVQSSSATMVITLSALSTGTIPFAAAVGIIIGSELGTSLKLVLGSLKGIPEKRRLAAGNVIFNLFLVVFATLLMDPLISLVNSLTREQNSLVALVLFQSLINLGGIIIFFPFLEKFVAFLETKFTMGKQIATIFISSGEKPMKEKLSQLEKETMLFIYRVAQTNLEAFHIEEQLVDADKSIAAKALKKNRQYRTYNEKYENVKQAEGEILSFYTRLLKQKPADDELVRLDQLIASVRNAMYSAKGIKDLKKDRRELRESSEDIKYEQYVSFKNDVADFYRQFNDVLKITDENSSFGKLEKLLDRIKEDYNYRMHNIYGKTEREGLSDIDISTLLNINRELYSSFKAIIFSLKDYMLSPSRAASFDELPVTI